MGWRRWVGDEGKIISLDHYAQSAPGETLFKEFGFTVENVLNIALELLK
jgi:transketolase